MSTTFFIHCSYFLDSVDCRVVSVDDRPTQLTDYPGYENLTGEDRNNQFFGASVASSRDGSVIAACAPLYVTFGPRGNKREPTGDCFISKDLGGSFLRVSPCLREFDAFYRAAYRNISYDKGWVSESFNFPQCRATSVWNLFGNFIRS